MIPYILLYIFVFLLFRHQKKFYIVVPVLLVIFAYFRPDNVGSDFMGYSRMIEEGHYDIELDEVLGWYALGDYSADETKPVREFGFSFLICFLKILTDDSRLIISIIIALTYSIYLLAFRVIFKKDVISINIAVFILFSIFIMYSSFNTLRQGLSISIVTLGSVLYIKKNWLPAIILLLIAPTIHFSATLIIPIVLISPYIKINIKWGISLLLIASVISVSGMDFFMKMIGDSSNFAGRDLEHGWNERKEAFNAIINGIQFIFNLFSIYIFYIYYKSSDVKARPFYNLWYAGLLIYILLISSANIGRIAEFLYVNLVFAISLTLKTYNKGFTIGGTPQYGILYQNMILYCIVWQSFYILRNFYGLQPLT